MKRWNKIKIVTIILCLGLMIGTPVLAKNKQTVTGAKAKLEKLKQVEEELTQEETSSLLSDRLSVYVDDEGVLELFPLTGGENEAEITFTVEVEDPEIIDVDQQGKWQALKAGETNLVVTFFDASQEERMGSQRQGEEEALEFPEIGQQIIPVIVADLTQFDITPYFEGAEIKAKVNETGKITVKSIEGVKMTGIFEPTTSEDGSLSIAEDGTWTALKAGSTTLSLTEIFKYSEESLAALAEKYPGHEFVISAIDQRATIEIEPVEGNLSLFPHLVEGVLETEVGQTGQINIKPIGELTDLEWEFELTDEKGLIEVDEKGNWRALQAGETELIINPKLSEESVKRLKEKYPENEFKTPAAPPEILKVKIKEETLTSSSAEEIPSKPTTELPQTSTRLNQGYQLIGLLLLLVFFIVKQVKLSVKK